MSPHLFLAAATLYLGTAGPIAPASCNDFVHTYLAAGLADGSTVTATLEVNSIQTSTVLTLRYPPYPRVAGQLRGGILITLDNGQVNAQLRTEAEERNAHVLGCIGPDHLYATVGDQLLGFSLAPR